MDFVEQSTKGKCTLRQSKPFLASAVAFSGGVAGQNLALGGTSQPERVGFMFVVSTRSKTKKQGFPLPEKAVLQRAILNVSPGQTALCSPVQRAT